MNDYGRSGSFRYQGGGGSSLAQRGHLVSPATSAAVGSPAPPSYVRKLNPDSQDDLFPGAAGVRTRRSFDVNRIVEAGGNLTSQMLHPSIIPFEELYRRLPEEGMFSSQVSPSKPFVFELGAFQVPPKMTLMIFDLRPDIYRFSGVDAGDYVPIEERRFGSIMGFDLTIDQRRTGEVAFELDPVPIQRTSQQAFTNRNLQHPTFNASQAAVAQASSFASSAGAGSSLLPQRHERYGALNVPFTLYARSNQTVQVRCVIFRPLPSPIAFIEYDIAGVLVPENWAQNMSEVIRPPDDSSEGIR